MRACARVFFVLEQVKGLPQKVCTSSAERRRMEENLMTERKEMILSLMNEAEYVPMKIKELAALMDIPRERRGGPAGGPGSPIAERKKAQFQKRK